MHKTLRALLALFAVLSLSAVAAGCGDDDDGDEDAAEATTTTAAEEGDEEGGPPDVNPCAEGESGTLGPTTPPEDGATPITVTAKEYEFAGLDAVTAPGSYALEFENAGQELHEVVVQRINDDETRSLEELLADENADPAEFSTDVAFGFACPGVTADPIAFEIEDAGRYVAVCFIPVGTLPTTPPADFEKLGPPHAVQGMAVEFTVS